MPEERQRHNSRRGAEEAQCQEAYEAGQSQEKSRHRLRPQELTSYWGSMAPVLQVPEDPALRS